MRYVLPISLAGVASLAAIAFLIRPVETGDAPTETRAAIPTLRTEHEGIRLDVDLRSAAGAAGLHAGDEAVATFTLLETRTGEPLRGAHPRAWLSAVRDDEEAGTCTDRVKRFSAGLLSARADADFNQNYVLAMNADNTISVIDAHLAFDRTRLRSLITLPAPAGDWVLHPDRTAVYVTVPGADSVSVIDTRTLLATGSLPVGTRPGRIAIAPDARRLWVSNDGGRTVSVIDHASRKTVDALDAGEGRRRIAFGDEGRTAWVTSDGTGELHAFDAVTLERSARIAIGEGPLFLAASPTARAVWVGRAAGELVEVDERTSQVRKRIEMPSGMTDLRFDPSGRWAFALFAERGEVAVVDASAGTVRVVLDGLATPDAIAFTQRFAYVREREKPTQLLVDLRALANPGAVPLVEVGIGQKSPSEGAFASLASPMAPLSSGDGMIVASPADRTLLYYTEGMMAPMGSLRNYGREPRAALVLDRSLFEVQPGIYRTQVRLPSAGAYDLTVYIGQPRMALCLRVDIDPVPGEEPAGPAVTIEPDFDPTLPLEAGVEHRLRFRVNGADDVRAEEIALLAFRPPGTWQWRGGPVAVDGDTFEIVLRPPEAGRIKLLAALPGRDAPFGTFPPIDLPVQPAATTSLTAEDHP